MVFIDSVGNGVAEKLSTGSGGMKIVAGVNESFEAFVVKKARVIGIGKRETLGSGKVDSILKVKLDSGGFFNFIESGEVDAGNAVAKNNRIRGNSGGDNDFSVGKFVF